MMERYKHIFEDLLCESITSYNPRKSADIPDGLCFVGRINVETP